ncbi:MAG: hypothetical protein JSW27_13255 [Phycisphaerales bacterium]|nr:MAG: hypothetical protein JSW27_13255 [Phycisphaerales bacterium]
MVPTRQVDLETHMADLLLKSEAALDELHRYYQVGRHEGKFVEKPYFLLSHCAHLLFSVWLAESEAPSGLFQYSPSLNALNANVDFGALRYTDYVRRTVHADALQEHVKNEPKWFRFWVKVLENQDGRRPLDCRRFSQTILTFVNYPDFLEGKVPKKARKGLADLLKTDTVAWIFQQSMSVLEELTAAIVSWFTRLDQSRHTKEQLVSLICMLHQVRRTIVSRVPAEGPYILLSNKDWGIPSALVLVYGGRTRGRLKVVPKRDGGSIVCACTWTSGAESKRRSWMRDFSALTRPYEELLFKTWSYDTGEPLNHPEPSADSQARWLVQSAEAGRLQIIFRHIETVSKALVRNPLCTGLTADIARLTKDDPDDWCNTGLTWTYIKELDQLLNKVKFAYREARVLGGDNPGAEVVSDLWPPRPSACKPGEQPVWRESHVTERSEESPSPTASSSPEPALPEEETRVEVQPPEDRGEEKGQASADDSIESWQPEESCSQGSTPAEPTTDDFATEEPEGEADSATETQDGAEPVAERDGEATEEQGFDEPSGAAETEEGNGTPLLGDPMSDDAEPAPAEPAAEESPTDELSETWEPEECRAQTPAPPEPVAQELSAEEPEGETGRAAGEQEVEEAVAHLEEEVQAREETVEASSPTECRADHSESQPCLTSDQSPCQSQGDPCESHAEDDREIASTAGQSSDQQQDDTQDPPSRAGMSQAEVSHLVLREKLLQWHQPAEGPINYEPLSLKQLRQGLECTRSEIQRMMTTIFGRRPFTVYREKCGDKTVCAFLEASANAQAESHEGSSDDSRSSTLVAIATSDRLFCEHISQQSGGSSATSTEAMNTGGDTDPKGPERTEMYHRLLDRLLEHHRLPDGQVCGDPLSLKQLQQDLAWKASEVQRIMTNIFGRRPFTAYKKKCADGVLGDFLEACDRQRTDSTDDPHQTLGEAAPQAV